VNIIKNLLLSFWVFLSGTHCLADPIEEFYKFEHEDVAGPRGSVVSFERLNSSPGASVGYRFLYRTEIADGVPTIASAVAWFPTTVADSAVPLKTTIFLRSTVGIAPHCAASRPNSNSVSSYVPNLRAFLKAGHAVLVPDLIGIGAHENGFEKEIVHSYLQKEPTANAVIDAHRALKNLPKEILHDDVLVGKEVAFIGHSQGAYSVLSSLAKIHETKTPGVEVVAAIISAQPGRLDRLVPLQRTQSGLMLSAYLAASFSKFHPELYFKDWLADEFSAIVHEIAGKCLSIPAEAAQIATLIASSFDNEDFGDTDGKHLRSADLPDDWEVAFQKNVPTFKSGEKLEKPYPIIISQGGSDPIVPWRATRDDVLSPLCEALSNNGTFVFYPFAGHNGQFQISAVTLANHLLEILGGQSNRELPRMDLPPPPLDPSEHFSYLTNLERFSFREPCELFEYSH
tara:strand:- start:10409 stop:11776 length:1368 start_codon:yes stop_codon:yes gene_type:complete